MSRCAWLVLAAALAGGCVSGEDASNGALRVLHAVPDGPRLNLYVDGRLQASGFDYRTGSAYLAYPAGSLAVDIDEVLPGDADPDTRRIFDETVALSVNDEVTLVVVGEAASQSEEVLRIPTRTQGVATGRTRVQALHAALGAPPVDVYLLEPDALVSASTPLGAALAYKSWTPQSEVSGGDRRLVVTAAGNPAQVLLESAELFLPLEGTVLIAVVLNTGLDAADYPVTAVLLTGSGSAVITDKDTPANIRLVNASPGSYALDAFVNETSVDDSARQVCDTSTSEADTLLEKCALAYESVGAFDALEAGSYDLKLQKSADDAVSARTSSLGLAASGELTVLVRGLLDAAATETTVTLQSLFGTRRVATAAQLRIVDASLAADDAVEGDPSTDRLEIYITPACAGLEDETADFTGLVAGSDTGYRSYVGGNYQVTLARTDTAVTPLAPEVLLSKQVTIDEGGVYALVIADSVGGVQPLKYLSLDDDPALTDCPAPP